MLVQLKNILVWKETAQDIIKIKPFYTIVSDVVTILYATKMWQMAIFIRHNCGERKNNVGHRWFNMYIRDLDKVTRACGCERKKHQNHRFHMFWIRLKTTALHYSYYTVNITMCTFVGHHKTDRNSISSKASISSDKMIATNWWLFIIDIN